MSKCRLETGRTHQIRVHMSYIGHPLFNDERYGGAEIRKGTIYAKYRQFIQNCFEIVHGRLFTPRPSASSTLAPINGSSSIFRFRKA